MSAPIAMNRNARTQQILWIALLVGLTGCPASGGSASHDDANVLSDSEIHDARADDGVQAVCAHDSGQDSPETAVGDVESAADAPDPDRADMDTIRPDQNRTEALPHDSDDMPSADTLADARDSLETSDVSGPTTCNRGRLRMLHMAAWPGRGSQFTVHVTDAAGQPVAGLTATDFILEAGNRPLTGLQVGPARFERGFLLLLIDDSATETPASPLRQAAADFVADLPASIAVAVYRRCAAIDQVVGFAEDKTLVAEQLRTGDFGCTQAPAIDPWSALQAAVDETSGIGGTEDPAMRTVVFLGSQLSGSFVNPVSPAGDVQVLAVVQDSAGLDAGCPATVDVVPWQTAADIPAALAEVRQQLDQASTGSYIVAGCPGMPDETPVKLSVAGGAYCMTALPDGPGETADLPCDATTIATGRPSFPTRIEFQFTAAQRAVFDEFVANSKTDDFDLDVRVGEALATPAQAHLRGQTSLDCARKSFSVNLHGNKLRRLVPGLASDEFMLLSMCLDDRYFHQYLADRLTQALGLYESAFGYVELVIDGQSAGVYLLMEAATDAILKQNARVRVVVRRRFDPSDIPVDIHYPPDTARDDPSVASYFALAGEAPNWQGEALVDEMFNRMDLDGFLRWLAFQSVMQCGDYADEAYFYATEAVRAAGISPWYQIMGWDQEDVFKSCHHSGTHAMADPYGLLYCAEGNLENALMTDPVVYRRFVGILEQLLTADIDESRMEAAVQRTADDLLPFFERPEICAAMIELLDDNPLATDPTVARTDILATMDVLRQQYRNRRAVLLERIGSYRQQNRGQ